MGEETTLSEEQNTDNLTDSNEAEDIAEQEEQDFLAEFAAEDDADSENLVVNSDTPDDQPDEGATEKEAEPEPEPEPAEQPAPEVQDVDRFQQLEDKLSQRMRNIEGHFGGLKSELLNALKEAKKDTQSQGDNAPSAKEIKEAAKSSEKLEALKSDFPEWSEALDEQMSVLEERISGKVDPDEIQQNLTKTMNAALTETAAQLREIVRVDAAFPGWEDTVKSQEFDDWAKAQPQEVQGLIQSPRATDAIRMLKMFDERNGKPDAGPDTTERDEKLKARLAAAVTPTKGGNRAAPRQLTEEEEFIKAFNS